MNEDILEYKKKLKENISILIENQNLKEAKELITQYEEIVEEDIEIFSIKAVIAIMEGKLDKAKTLLDEGILLDSNNEDLLYNNGYFYKTIGEFNKSMYFYKKLYSRTKDSKMRNDLEKFIKDLSGDIKTTVLIGSPVHQKPEILKEFLESLKELKKGNIQISYFFIDDNTDYESSELLLKFRGQEKNVHIDNSKKNDEYVCDDNTHYWKENLVWKVADFKDRIIQYAKNNNYDYLFFLDSDLVLHPNTLQHLISTGKDIISEIFWTKWQTNSIELPQVWLKDTYTQYHLERGEKLSESEINIRFKDFLNTLRIPGVYQVGGLGACTLISAYAINKGVSFKEIKNLSFWGEDRHFCIRAMALGLSLYVDTHYPAYHIYRKEDLKGVSEYKEVNNFNTIKKLNILYLYDYMRLGGAETHIITLSAELKKMGHNIYIAAPDGPAVKLLKKHQLKHIKCDLNNVEDIDSSINSMINIIRKYKIDVIHAHPYMSQIIGCASSIKTGIPVVTTLHSTYQTPSDNEPYKSIIKKYICVSEEVIRRKKSIGYNNKDMIVINNSVSIQKEPKFENFFEDGIIKLIYISRLDDDKVSSLKKLLNSIPGIVNKGLNIKLTIIGEGNRIEEIRTICKLLNDKLSRNIITLVGGTTKVNEYIAESDVVIGVGRVVIEGIGNGKFTICLGNNNYPGLINKKKLLKISKVNFTDRNCIDNFTEDKLFNNLYQIYNNLNKEIITLQHTYNFLKEKFSTDVSANMHLESYLSVLK